MKRDNITDGAFQYSNWRRLSEAKCEFYGFLLRSKYAPDDVISLTDLSAGFSKRSALKSALQNGTLPDRTTFGDLVRYLRAVIYRSEVKLGDQDHFDDRIGALLPLAEHEPPEPAEPEVEIAQKRPNRALQAFKWLALCVVALAIGLLVLILVEYRQNTKALAAAGHQISTHTARLAQVLPHHHFMCLRGDDSCKDQTHVENVFGALNAALAAMDVAILQLNGGALDRSQTTALFAKSAVDCRISDNVLRELCVSRTRLFAQRDCVEASRSGTASCLGAHQLGIAGTEFEEQFDDPAPRTVNVFSQPVELTDEFRRIFLLSNSLHTSASVADASKDVWNRLVGGTEIFGDWLARRF